MKIALIAAMQKELNLLLPLLENRTEFTIDSKTYHRGNIGANEIVAGQCGIGKVNSALATLRLIQEEQPDLVINSGVAGGAAPDIHPLDVVIAREVAYHDVWCGPGSQYGAADGYPVRMKADEAAVKAASAACPEARKGLICSGDMFIDSLSQVETICSRFADALAVDMESASIAQTCISRNVPFAIIRVISDSPRSGDNFSQYLNFWDDAPKATFHAVSRLLASLS